MMKIVVSVLICSISLIVVSCTKDDNDYKTFVFKTIDLVTNKPIENVKIRFGMEIGCSKLLDFKEEFTNKDGTVEIDIVKQGEQNIIVFSQKVPITIDQNNPSNNNIQINY